MTLQEILKAKGSLVHRIGADETLAEVVRRLFEHRIGSLVVCDNASGNDRRVVGIITERDILRALAERGAGLDELLVKAYMTADLTTASPSDEVAAVMGWMTEHRIRHLPVLDDDILVGIISIGDVVKAQHDQMVMENHYLKSYVNGGITADII